MKQYFFPVLCSILSFIVCRSQEYRCDCMENLDLLILKTEQNYAGFPSKVNDGMKDAYNNLVMEVRESAGTTEGAKDCFYIMKKYVKYFNDKHFNLAYRNPKDFDSTVVRLPYKNIRKALKGDNDWDGSTLESPRFLRWHRALCFGLKVSGLKLGPISK